MPLTRLIPFAGLAGVALAMTIAGALCTTIATAPTLTDLSARIVTVLR